jgi:hypothetical protein
MQFTRSDGGYAVHSGGRFIGCAFRYDEGRDGPGWIGEPVVFDTDANEHYGPNVNVVSWELRVGPYKTRKEAAEAMADLYETKSRT